MTTRNSILLAEFVAYCEANPTMRFWQALRNWSGHSMIVAIPIGKAGGDTFYWESRDGG